MRTDDLTESPPRAGRREWLGLAVLALPTLLLALDLSVLYLALPELSADLRPGSTEALWILDIYGFMIAGFLVTMGTLGDRIGRRKLLLIGAAAFGAASVAAAYSTSPAMLIGSRAILGIAGATLMPSTLALISNMFRDPAQRGVAIAVWMSSFMGGTALGPVVGGGLLEFFWWGSVFLMGVPVMALLLVTAPLLLPEYRDTEAGRLDLFSVVLSLAAILPVIYSIKEMAKDGLEGQLIASMAIGFVFGAIFVRRQHRLADPLLDVSLFKNRAFTSALTLFLFAGASLGGLYFFITQYLQLVEELSPVKAGLWLVPPTIAMIASSMIAPPLAQRVPPGYVVAGGMAIMAAGTALLTQTEATSGLAIVLISFGVIGVGMGPVGSLSTDMVVGAAPREKAGSASAMSETSGELGMALGVAIMGSVGTAVYRDEVSSAIPAGTSPEASDAIREGLPGAAKVAAQLPGGAGTTFLGEAQAAFTTGLTTLAALGTVILAILAIVASVMLRHVRSAGTDDPSGPAGEDITPELSATK